MDVKTTFLHGILEGKKKDISMGLKQEYSQMVCKIYKSLYGLKSMAWYQNGFISNFYWINKEWSWL